MELRRELESAHRASKNGLARRALSTGTKRRGLRSLARRLTPIDPPRLNQPKPKPTTRSTAVTAESTSTMWKFRPMAFAIAAMARSSRAQSIEQVIGFAAQGSCGTSQLVGRGDDGLRAASCFDRCGDRQSDLAELVNDRHEQAQRFRISPRRGLGTRDAAAWLGHGCSVGGAIKSDSAS